MFYIYKITNKINNKIYIGKTCKSIEWRFNGHIRDSLNENAKGYNTPIHRSIRKRGKDNFYIEEVDRCLYEDEVNFLERYYIYSFNSTDKSVGYNVLLGGDGFSRGHVSYNKGKPMSEDQKNKISLRHKEGRYNNSYKLLSVINKRPKTDEEKRNMSKAVKNKNKVECIETGEIFDSSYDVERKYGFKNVSIRRVCSGKIKSSYNLHWRYL